MNEYDFRGHLVFVEDRAQAARVAQSRRRDATTTIVALTAEGMQALEEYGVPHHPACAFADMRQLAATEDQFKSDSFCVAQETERSM